MKTPIICQGSYDVMYLRGRLNLDRRHSIIQSFRAWLRQAAQGRSIEIDCSGLSHVDRAGLAILATLHDEARLAARRLSIINENKALPIQQVIHIPRRQSSA